MLTGMLMAAAMMQAQAGLSGALRETVKDKVCAQRLPAIRGEAFRLVPIPTRRRPNESGVLLLINCSDRKVVSLRDPSRSPRHVREFVYVPGFRARMRRDPHGYEVLNFNKEVHNTGLDHTAYSRWENWTGPCVYRGLELITAAAHDPADRRTVTFDLDICRNLILALLSPAGSAAAAPTSAGGAGRE